VRSAQTRAHFWFCLLVFSVPSIWGQLFFAFNYGLCVAYERRSHKMLNSVDRWSAYIYLSNKRYPFRYIDTYTVHPMSIATSTRLPRVTRVEETCRAIEVTANCELPSGRIAMELTSGREPLAKVIGVESPDSKVKSLAFPSHKNQARNSCLGRCFLSDKGVCPAP